MLNPARTDMSEEEQAGLGRRFLDERKRQLDADCGAVDAVRRLVRRSYGPGRPGGTTT